MIGLNSDSIRTVASNEQAEGGDMDDVIGEPNVAGATILDQKNRSSANLTDSLRILSSYDVSADSDAIEPPVVDSGRREERSAKDPHQFLSDIYVITERDVDYTQDGNAAFDVPRVHNVTAERDVVRIPITNGGRREERDAWHSLWDSSGVGVTEDYEGAKVHDVTKVLDVTKVRDVTKVHNKGTERDIIPTPSIEDGVREEKDPGHPLQASFHDDVSKEHDVSTRRDTIREAIPAERGEERQPLQRRDIALAAITSTVAYTVANNLSNMETALKPLYYCIKHACFGGPERLPNGGCKDENGIIYWEGEAIEFTYEKIHVYYYGPKRKQLIEVQGKRVFFEETTLVQNIDELQAAWYQKRYGDEELWYTNLPIPGAERMSDTEEKDFRKLQYEIAKVKKKLVKERLAEVGKSLSKSLSNISLSSTSNSNRRLRINCGSTKTDSTDDDETGSVCSEGSGYESVEEFAGAERCRYRDAQPTSRTPPRTPTRKSSQAKRNWRKTQVVAAVVGLRKRLGRRKSDSGGSSRSRSVPSSPGGQRPLLADPETGYESTSSGGSDRKSRRLESGGNATSKKGSGAIAIFRGLSKKFSLRRSGSSGALDREKSQRSTNA